MIEFLGVFWKVWLAGFSVFLLTVMFAMGVIVLSGRRDLSSMAKMDELRGDPAAFVWLMLIWFVKWPYLLLRGVWIAIDNPDRP